MAPIVHSKFILAPSVQKKFLFTQVCNSGTSAAQACVILLIFFVGRSAIPPPRVPCPHVPTEKYYAQNTFYALETLRDIDNPDQRIAEDVRTFAQGLILIFPPMFIFDVANS